MSDEFALDLPLTREEKKIKIGATVYRVKEMLGVQRDSWMTKMGKRVKTGADGKPTGTLSDYNGVQADLIELCLYTEDDKPIPLGVAKEWPAKIQAKVFELCQELNGLGDEKNADAVKND